MASQGYRATIPSSNYGGFVIKFKMVDFPGGNAYPTYNINNR